MWYARRYKKKSGLIPVLGVNNNDNNDDSNNLISPEGIRQHEQTK